MSKELKVPANANIHAGNYVEALKLVGKKDSNKEFTTFTAFLNKAVEEALEKRTSEKGSSELIQSFEKYYKPANLIEIILSAIKIDMKDEHADVFLNKKWHMTTHRGPIYNSEALLFAHQCVKGVINFTESFCSNLDSYKKELIKQNNV